MTSVPTEAKVCLKVFFRPFAAVIVVTTARMPMTMPSVVSTPRLLFAAIADMAILKDSERSRPSFMSAALVALDQAVAQAHHAVRVRRDVVLVRDQDDGVALGVQVAEHRHDLLPGGGVEVAGGFVGQDDRGLAHQRARDRDALALAAGQLV